MSGERIVFGVGAGWAEAEFAGVGAAFAERGRRMRIARRHPRPVRGRDRGGVFEPALRTPLPAMIGGTTGPGLGRAARYADEWQGLGVDGAGSAGRCRGCGRTAVGGCGRLADAGVRRVRVGAYGGRRVWGGTWLGWSGGDHEPVVAMARELVGAGVETPAVLFGEEGEAVGRMIRFHDLFTALFTAGFTVG
ncbi:hypothetical protein [Kribbella sp.]|uniref:hypothetical protein n=1 Tax=Kribbella sp. TaxID=1871183 RepID=UPI002D53AFE7|nr:hypothetical protein [Kribbella sp.]HZX05870.1 hypothetical protein [Kribbella sp.]